MRISKQAWVDILKFLMIIVFIYFFLKVFFVPILASEEFKEFVRSVGVGGYFILFLYIVISHIFAPLAGTPGVVLGSALYGLGISMIILYFAGIVSSIITFYISRRYGRKFVIKLVGEKGMQEVDEFTALEGSKTLIISRLLGFSIFEFISYAAGLTKMSFKSYISITVVTSAITHLLSYFLFKDLDLGSEKGIFIWVVFLLGIGLIFTVLVRSYLKHRKR